MNLKSGGLVFIASAGLLSCVQAKTAERINVIYILADDLGYGDLGCTGGTRIETPNIDRLRAEGMLFTQHYSGSTVSAPSRSSLMTGMHTGHTPIRGNLGVGEEGQTPLPADTYTIGKMFKSADYVTGIFGKWGLGYPGSEGDPLYQGFDHFFGYNCQRHAHRYYPAHLWDDLQKVALEENIDGLKGTYAPDTIHRRSLDFIRENRDNKFFLFLPFILPHAELLVPEDGIIRYYRGKFDEHQFVNMKGEYGPDMDAGEYCSQSEPHATFAAMVARFDMYVGEIMDLLRELGLDNDTLIMLSSDNGPHREGGGDPVYFESYGPFRGIKRDLYEGGIRVPLIAWWPGRIERGSTSDHICAFWDILPTFADVAGVKLPKKLKLDGISIVPALTGRKRQSEHRYLYWEFHEAGGKVAVRKGNWKAVRKNVLLDPDAPTELYDLSSDIHEDRNVAGQFPETVADLESIMKIARTESEIFKFTEQIN